MKILFLHGWNSVPGGVKPGYLKDHGHEVINPALPHDDFSEAVRIAQVEFDKHKPDVIVGSSRGGAVALNMNSGESRLVLLCPAWKKYGTVKTAKAGTVILHSRADDVVPFADSEELVKNSGLRANRLIEVGIDHRLASSEPLAAMLKACAEIASTHLAPCFGVSHEGTVYVERKATYGIVFDDEGSVAVVKGPSGRYWLPGGGALPGESAEDTLNREIREELACNVRLIERIGEATQYFFASGANKHFKMTAVFFRAEFKDKLSNQGGEHELCWLPVDQAISAFFHECHGWALVQAVSTHRQDKQPA